MATKVLDYDKALELLRRYRPALAITKGGGGLVNFQFLCPFHADTHPSYIFSPYNNKGSCFACKQKGSFEDVVGALENTSPENVKSITESCKKLVRNDTIKARTPTIDVSLAQIEEWHKALSTHTHLSTLAKKWGWSKDTLEKYLIGASDNRMTIPMFEGEHLVGLKYYTPGAKKMKYQNADGSISCAWPLENLQQEEVYLVEGEKDCLTMLSAGFNAVTFTTGAGSVAKEYIKYFAGKTVYIIYDIDESGRKGAVSVANTLSCAARRVFIVELPLEGIPKGDLTDAYMRSPDDFSDFILELVRNTTEYQPPAAVNRVTVDPDVVKTYLEDIVPKKLFYRRINMKIRVVGNSQIETVLVPKDVVLTCNKDYKDVLCQQCPLYYKPEGLPLHVKPHYPEIMSMVGNNMKATRAAIQSMTDVVEGCPKFKIEQKAHQALYRIFIIPSIEADKKTHNYQMREGWSLDVPSKDNIDYDVEAVTLANPENQRMEIICYRMDEDGESIDSFELSPELAKQLEVFQTCEAHPLTASPVS